MCKTHAKISSLWGSLWSQYWRPRKVGGVETSGWPWVPEGGKTLIKLNYTIKFKLNKNNNHSNNVPLKSHLPKHLEIVFLSDSWRIVHLKWNLRKTVLKPSVWGYLNLFKTSKIIEKHKGYTEKSWNLSHQNLLFIYLKLYKNWNNSKSQNGQGKWHMSVNPAPQEVEAGGLQSEVSLSNLMGPCLKI